MQANITLFSPIKLGPYTLPNRMAMAPMTRNRAGKDNVPQAMNVEYYAQRASAGLIITEGAQIAADAVGYPATPGIHSVEQVEGWKRVTDAVHAKGGHIFLQLWHCGRISHPYLLPGGKLPVAPSAIKPKGHVFTLQGMQDYAIPRTLSIAEIHAIIEQYRGAAENAVAAGFDGVEIHGANGYLLDQFLRDGSNKRVDAYGDTVSKRARLMLEVTQAVCSVWGGNRVGIRLSPLQPFNDMHDSSPEETFSHVVKELNRFGLAYLHITEMGKEKPGAAGPAFDLNKLRKIWKGVYMTNSGYDLTRSNAALAANEADMVSFGVSFIANPDLPARFAKGAPLNTPDTATFYGGNEKGYTDYPVLS
ncbi:MAG: alkene reductase [Gallionellaceae bacterium]|nr:alkene reductase [Gallionellaceae bacterium]